jgi:DNA-binding NarL/FixJ family response regulator
LPESSGPESYAWVREIAANIPVVVLTGDARQETEAAVTASGVEYYLVKDQVSGALLLRAIRASLSAKRGGCGVRERIKAGKLWALPLPARIRRLRSVKL